MILYFVQTESKVDSTTKRLGKNNANNALPLFPIKDQIKYPNLTFFRLLIGLLNLGQIEYLSKGFVKLFYSSQLLLDNSELPTNLPPTLTSLHPKL